MTSEQKQKLKAFKRDLKELLEEHDANLWIMLGGDTHGIHDEGIGVSFERKPIIRLTDSGDWHIGPKDL